MRRSIEELDCYTRGELLETLVGKLEEVAGYGESAYLRHWLIKHIDIELGAIGELWRQIFRKGQRPTKVSDIIR